MRMILHLLSLLFAFTATALAYKNPIIPGFNPDPTIIRTGEDYFLATSTFEFFPSTPIYHSTDLIDWTLIGHALNRPSQLNLRGTAPSGGTFAPTLRFHDGTYYLITTWFDIISPPDNSTKTPVSMFVTTDNIWDETSWSDPIYVEQEGFDPDLFFGDDGKVYLTTTFGANDFGHPNSGYFSIFVSEIDIKTGNPLTETQFLHQSPLALDAPRLAEGSHIKKINGTYYLITADGGTEAGSHREMAYRASSPYGPWIPNPSNPLIWNGKNLSNPILATGHADFVETPEGDWWAVLLGVRPQNPTNGSGTNQLGRETFLAPLTWEDGWPVINGGKDLTFTVPGLYNLTRPKIWRDDFDGCLVDKAYYTQRTPYKSFHTFPSSGGLSLRGNSFSLSDRDTPAALLRKQTLLNTNISTHLTFSPTSPLHEAGLTIFLSIHYHNEVGITRHPETNRTVVFATTRTGVDAKEEVVYVDLGDAWKEEDGVELVIEVKPEGYRLGFVEVEGTTRFLKEVEGKWLQTFLPGWQNFVGAHFGIYATGNRLPILQAATFKYLHTDGNDDDE